MCVGSALGLPGLMCANPPLLPQPRSGRALGCHSNGSPSTCHRVVDHASAEKVIERSRESEWKGGGGRERKYRALFDTASRSCSDTLLTTTVYPGHTHTHTHTHTYTHTHVTPSNSPLMFSIPSPPHVCCFDFSANPFLFVFFLIPSLSC